MLGSYCFPGAEFAEIEEVLLWVCQFLQQASVNNIYRWQSSTAILQIRHNVDHAQARGIFMAG